MEMIIRGKIVLVDDDDVEKISKYKWYINHGYAVRGIKINDKKQIVFLHRFVTSAPVGMEVDHKNRNKLDNRKENLRICTRAQNMQNKIISARNPHGYKGISWVEKGKHWRAAIVANGKKYTKCCKRKEDAAQAYRDMAHKYHGEFANY